MSYGVEIRNTNNHLLLDDRDDFMRLYQEGSVGVYTDKSNYMWNAHLYRITLNSKAPPNEPLLFTIQPGDTFICPYGVDEDSNGNIIGYLFWCKVDTTFSYKVYSQYAYEQPPRQSDWGMQIFNENGRVLYDSTIAEGRFIDVFTVGGNDSSGGLTHTAETYSHILTPGAFYSINTFPIDSYHTVVDPTQDWGYWYLKGFKQNGDGSMAVDFVEISSDASEFTKGNNSGPVFIVNSNAY